MSSFDDTNEMKAFTKKAMSIPLLAEEHEKVLAKKWIEKKDECALHELTPVSYTHLTLPTKRIV